LTRFRLGLRVFADVLGQRPADVVGFVETGLVITADVTLVVASVDQFAFAVMLLFSHCALLRSGSHLLNSKWRAIGLTKANWTENVLFSDEPEDARIILRHA